MRLLTDPAFVARVGQGRRTDLIGWLMIANGASQLLGIDLGLGELIGAGAAGEPTFAQPTAGMAMDPVNSILTGAGLITLGSRVSRNGGNGTPPSAS